MLIVLGTFEYCFCAQKTNIITYYQCFVLTRFYYEEYQAKRKRNDLHLRRQVSPDGISN